MAISLITFSIRDDKRQLATTSIHVEYPDLILEERGNPADYAAQYAEFLDDLIEGQIVAINISTSVPLPVGLKSVPNLTSDVEEGATFLWRTANGYTVRQRIPTFSESFVLDGGIVDRDTDEVSILFEMTVNPIELPADYLVSPCDSRGDDIIDLVRAIENFKRTTRHL